MVTRAYPVAALWAARLDAVCRAAENSTDPEVRAAAPARARKIVRHIHRIRRVQLAAQAEAARL